MLQPGEEAGIPCLGQGLDGSLVCADGLFFRDQKGAECHPGQGSTFLDLRSLREPLVASVVVQADRLLFSVKASHGAQPIARMPDQGSSPQAKAPGS